MVLSFPDMRNAEGDVAIPLRLLAEFWLAYYWPFVDPDFLVLQGPRSERQGVRFSDMAFRADLTAFRASWEGWMGGVSQPADGFFILHEMRIARRREVYSEDLLSSYAQAIRSISRTLEMPIRYAGPGEWTVFKKPTRYNRLGGQAVPVPGTQDDDVCLVIDADLWRTFLDMSLWIEALCIHEWCLFSERVEQADGKYVERGPVYQLLTARPDNRRPLTWERNNIEVLLMEGREFICPWTEKLIRTGVTFDIDHLIPLAIYPINELWNLVPADPHFNSHVKRDRLPTVERLDRAAPHLVVAYQHYESSTSLAQSLREDVSNRFRSVTTADFPQSVASAVTDFMSQLADGRNVARFT